MTSEPATRFSGPDEVVEHYKKTCKRLTEAEVNCNMFSKMIRSGVATNDVRNFINKQSKMKRVNQKMNIGLVKSTMKMKLNDACASANRLRQEKRKLKDLLIHKFKYSKSKCRKVVKSTVKETRSHRVTRKLKASKKYILCDQKMKKIIDDENLQAIPEEVLNIVSGVNIFKSELTPEPSADPMVCDPSIKLSKCEMAFLRRGPRFMMRQDLNLNSFKTEIEKMVAKEKYDKTNYDQLDGSSSTLLSEHKLDSNSSLLSEHKLDSKHGLTREEKTLEAKANMVYDKSEKSLDMGRLKATEYKFNKYVHLPKAESVIRESLHEVRRSKMVEVFMRLTAKAMHNKRNKKGDKDTEEERKIESNLSKFEQEGFKSLYKRQTVPSATRGPHWNEVYCQLGEFSYENMG